MRGTWRIRQFLARQRLARLRRQATLAVRHFPRVGEKMPHKLANGLIVTLTSYPPRFETLAATIKSLLDQTIVPDLTVLWLDRADIAKLPHDVLMLKASGLEIRGCDNLRSYKKLIPSLIAYPGATLVTADDDVYYAQNWLEGLLKAHLLEPARVIAWRAHIAHLDLTGVLARYADWEFATSRVHVDEPNFALFPTGVGGVLYPANSFHPDVLDEKAFMALCPNGDDIWFYWMARRAGTRHARVGGWLDLIEWPSTQQVGLRVDNVEGEGNDRQIFAMEKAYGPFPF